MRIVLPTYDNRALRRRRRRARIQKAAERGGFEPPVALTGYADLANRSIRPLWHLSGTTLCGCRQTGKITPSRTFCKTRHGVDSPATRLAFTRTGGLQSRCVPGANSTTGEVVRRLRQLPGDRRGRGLDAGRRGPPDHLPGRMPDSRPVRPFPGRRAGLVHHSTGQPPDGSAPPGTRSLTALRRNAFRAARRLVT